MDNTQERTKEIGSRSYVKSMRTDNTEDMAGNIKDELKYNGTYCSVSRFKPITWAQWQGWNSSSPICQHLNHFGEQKTLWIMNPLAHVYWQLCRQTLIKSTKNAPLVLGKKHLEDLQKIINLQPWIMHKNGHITWFKRYPQTRKYHKFSPNYLRTTPRLYYLGEELLKKLTVDPINGYPSLRDTVQSMKLIWLIGQENEVTILNTFLYISSFFI